MLPVEAIARICHQLNKAYCEALKDFSQMHWSAAPAWQRESAINGVKFLLEHPSSTPEDQHENWRKCKIEAGWRFGVEKNEHLKTHPCLKPYHELPIEQRIKDRLFQAVVRCLTTQET